MSYETFKLLCERQNVTPAAVSRATGIATSTLTEWKKGRYAPKTDKLQKIADYFGVSLEYLMTGEEPGYYVNPEAARRAQIMYQRPELALLFEAAEDAPPEDIELAYQMLKALKAKEGK